jgi:hypothetical protein
MRKARFLLLFGAIFGLVGLLIFCAGIGFAKFGHIISNTAKAEGRVVALDDRGFPRVSFLDPRDGRTYTFEGSFNTKRVDWVSLSYEVDEMVPVAFDPDNPSGAVLDWGGRVALPVWFMALGGPFALSGGIVTLLAVRTRARHRWLLANGRERWADIEEISRNTRVELNGRNPYIVRAHWRDELSGRHHTATSDYIWQDPSRELAGQQVRVLFDPADPDRNVIDITTTRPE